MTKTYLKFRSRISVIICLTILSWMGLCGRLFQVQILDGKMYQQEAIDQGQRKEKLFPNRGNIFDRNNVWEKMYIDDGTIEWAYQYKQMPVFGITIEF